MHDARTEYVEACATAALVQGEPLPSPEALVVEPAAWLIGLAEAASERTRDDVTAAAVVHRLQRVLDPRLS